MRQARAREPRDPLSVVTLIGWGLVVLVACGLAGAGVGWVRRGSGRTEPDPAKARAEARAQAGAELRKAFDALYSEDAERAERALSALESADPANGYAVFLRVALLQTRKSDAGVAPLLDAAAAAQWDLYVDAAGMPDRVTQDRELTAIRRTTEGLCLAATAGALGDPRTALDRLRAMGLRLATAVPRDLVHVQAGADMRRRASDEMVVVARQRAVPEEVREAESIRSADAAWQRTINQNVLQFVSRQTRRKAFTESDLYEAVAQEDAVIAELLGAAPQ